MKNRILAAIAATPLLLVGWALSYAQDDATAMTITPVETYTCNYNDGKGPSDLDKATAAWNKWMDDNGIGTYGAITLTPWYFGGDTFDVGWLGYWNDGAAMGAGTDMYLATGGEAAAGFAEVVTCDSHTNFATTMIKSPGEGDPPDNMVVYFSDCNIKEGGDWDAVFGGLNAWGDYMTAQEYNNGVWVLFPAFGSGDMDFDFKYVTSFENHADAGKAYDKYANGGGWQKRNELLGDLLDCNVSRVYNAAVRRNPEMSDE